MNNSKARVTPRHLNQPSPDKHTDSEAVTIMCVCSTHTNSLGRLISPLPRTHPHSEGRTSRAFRATLSQYIVLEIASISIPLLWKLLTKIRLLLSLLVPTAPPQHHQQKHNNNNTYTYCYSLKEKAQTKAQRNIPTTIN